MPRGAGAERFHNEGQSGRIANTRLTCGRRCGRASERRSRRLCCERLAIYDAEAIVWSEIIGNNLTTLSHIAAHPCLGRKHSQSACTACCARAAPLDAPSEIFAADSRVALGGFGIRERRCIRKGGEKRTRHVRFPIRLCYEIERTLLSAIIICASVPWRVLSAARYA